ncbi:TetR/AcrR family transcriptional regulator [Streptomyces sp. WAC05374]|uniref:ScbR family autoregulator-binding transcription factor n=1 Tax=Streptomyces sp. WAC05374 TaxID=2487420 RepID=UPI000F87D5F6|nr:ScbR family autoregulator-binding transcription factor [Streptomyces sp. WAC05374]RST18401.1 TetR/AcrR family transcriptional regulator [Streptomyces sp. WAC05374]TDF36182.1 TetR/AcrR family transcriptional regulator [Streptomyces sp. WAC05374]TDF45700.1 TetR/AcrR family transcriptional regulator [Streptomyces sp. WAC05374]TDF46671.1 TetR/AcrR family transcriptional regulator [Streptomyces sp. WAC05374]
MVKQERAARTRQSLIRAAAEVFAQEGFAPASLATISRRAGVSNGALHFHFENKKALARAVEDEAAARVRRITAGVLEGGGSALQALVDTTHELMNRLAADIVVRAGFELGGDPARGEEPQLRREWQRWIEEALRRAEQEGGLAEGVSPDGAASTILAATVGFEVLGGENGEWLTEERITGFWDLLLPGLAGHCALLPVTSFPTGGLLASALGAVPAPAAGPGDEGDLAMPVAATD